MLLGRPWVVDGGLASALQDDGFSVDGHPLWSARILATNPGAVRKVHTTFLEAGADIIITASYQASIPGFQDHLGTTQDEAERIMNTSVSLAKEAIQEYESKFTDKVRKLLVAGSIGPYGACQADGSEYTGAYMCKVTPEYLKEWHRPRMAALVNSGVDLLAVETIPAQAEALAILDLLQEFPDTKAWLSFSCKDSQHTNYGDDFGEAVKKCHERAVDQLIAVGLNCTPPQYVTSLLEKADTSLPSPSILPRVVYPNSGEEWVAGKGWAGRSAHWPFLNEVKKWQVLGASVIGGCCRLRPNDIRDIASVVAPISKRDI
ncbi:homocysteine S-methyltransferase YbgG-like [Homarus americanus]|uniref:homocysteine S-methyltransferase YbgG-like n=1 Tax=Homarus americanus TaxID=6706 RepID=UPI001C43E998|nr:homocysteine S-methyltransferase YbgG-like [Homarus americanus]XP_042231726.1 homocysteine S-methyltransferase YbgG-like [Homarus americanus]